MDVGYPEVSHDDNPLDPHHLNALIAARIA